MVIASGGALSPIALKTKMLIKIGTNTKTAIDSPIRNGIEYFFANLKTKTTQSAAKTYIRTENSMPFYSLSVCLIVSNYFGVPHTLHPESRFRRTSFQLISLPSNMSKRPVKGLPAPLMSFRASAACMAPMMPTKGAKTPMVAQRASVISASGGKMQA